MKKIVVLLLAASALAVTCLAVETKYWQQTDQVDFEKWMRLDMQYIDNWSLSLDARIILRTIPQVLSGRAS